MTLYSRCCGAPDRPIKSLSDTSYSDEGICPKCGSHADFHNNELIEELLQVSTGKDLISITIRKSIKDKASHVEIFEYIKSQAKDNLRMMSEVLGIELTEKILT